MSIDCTALSEGTTDSHVKYIGATSGPVGGSALLCDGGENLQQMQWKNRPVGTPGEVLQGDLRQMATDLKRRHPWEIPHDAPMVKGLRRWGHGCHDELGKAPGERVRNGLSLGWKRPTARPCHSRSGTRQSQDTLGLSLCHSAVLSYDPNGQTVVRS
jgi:hypothetical protein